MLGAYTFLGIGAAYCIFVLVLLYPRKGVRYGEEGKANVCKDRKASDPTQLRLPNLH